MPSIIGAIWGKIHFCGFLGWNIRYNRGHKSRKSSLYYRRNLIENGVGKLKIIQGGPRCKYWKFLTLCHKIGGSSDRWRLRMFKGKSINCYQHLLLYFKEICDIIESSFLVPPPSIIGAIWGKFNFFGFLGWNIRYIRGQKSRKSVLYYRRNLMDNGEGKLTIIQGGPRCKY